MLRVRIRELAPFALTLFVILAGFYFPWLTGQRSFYLSDITYYFEPFLRFIGDALRKGELPLWNPYCYCGMSQVAIPSPGVFYPLNWLFALMPFNTAFALNLVLHQLIAGIGNFLLVAGLGWGLGPAWLAGLVAALSAYMFSLEANYTLMASAAWLPLALFFLTKVTYIYNRSNMFYVMASSVSIAMLVLAGRPEIFQPALLILGLYLLLSVFIDGEKSGAETLRQLCWRGIALVLGLLITAPSLLPVVEWKAVSPRALGLSLQEIFIWSANWYDLVCLVLPQPLGDFHLQGTRFLSVAAGRATYIPYLSSAFVGPVVVTLAIWGLFDKTWKWRFLLLAVLVGSLIMAMGNNTIVAPWLIEHLPYLNVFRYPIKLLYFPVWCLAVFAACGFKQAIEKRVSPAAQILALSGWSLVGIFGVTLLTWKPLAVVASQLSYFVNRGVKIDLLTPSIFLLGRAAVIASGIGLVIVLLSWLYSKGKLSSRNFIVVVLSSLVASLIVHAFVYQRHDGPSDFFYRDSHVADVIRETMQKNSQSLISRRILPLYSDPLARPDDPESEFNPNKGTNRQRTANFYQFARQLLLPNTNIDAAMPSSFGYEASETLDYRRLFIGALRKCRASFKKTSPTPDLTKRTDVPIYRFCQITSTEYVCTQKTRTYKGQKLAIPLLDGRFFSLIHDDAKWNLRIYKVDRPLPNVHFTYKWYVVPTQQLALGLIANADTTGYNPWVSTLIDQRPGVMCPLPMPELMVGDLKKNLLLNIFENSAGKLKLSIATPLPGMLLISNHYYPGWKALVDGKPAPIHRANGILMAVYVTGGLHTVELKFDPDSLNDGIKVALGAIIVLLVLLRFALKRA